MVTEFAQYGSINDLMKKRPNSDGISKSMKIKFMLDAAKGLQYLHTNGILHRDIKPDNYLVVSLDRNFKSNCKLTDFGTSRAIDAVRRDQTMTKGVGSPDYMSPEILDKRKYGLPSDIYSFAITMYEVFAWQEAYPNKEFRFPWKIAEFVMEGKRLQQLENISDDQFELVRNSWCQDSKERLSIDQIISILEEKYNSIDK